MSIRLRRAIERLFVTKAWATRSGDVLHLSQAGRFVIDRILCHRDPWPYYRPMFVRAQELLFGDATRVFARGCQASMKLKWTRTIM